MLHGKTVALRDRAAHPPLLPTHMSNPLSRLLGAFRSTNPDLAERVKDLKQKFDGLKEKSGAALKGFTKIEKESARMVREMETLKVLCGRIAAASISKAPPDSPFADVEFRVCSQWGEDGIIQHLINHLQVEKTFVEFGVENYIEANTRFLLIKDNWRGLIMDGSEENIASIRSSDIHWRHDLTAKCAFVTPGNINTLITDAGFGGKGGILSVDVDGMDYWIWKAVTAVDPAIVISEYNSVFGPSAAVTVPSDDQFIRSKGHHSGVFYGVSLAALQQLADEKGYDLVGVNSAGNNAFFVKRGIGSPFLPRKAADIFVEANFREARDKEGNLTYAGPEERRRVIADCDVFDLASQSVRRLGDVWKTA